MRYPSIHPHAEPGPFPTSTSFLTGEQSDSGPMNEWTTSEPRTVRLSLPRRVFNQKESLALIAPSAVRLQ